MVMSKKQKVAEDGSKEIIVQVTEVPY